MTNKLTPGEALQKILDALGVDDLNLNSRGLFEDYIRQAARAESAKELAEKDAEIERLKRVVAELASENAALKQSVIAANLDSDVWQTASNARDKEIERIADAIHWPVCWDTAAYPTLLSALQEIGCNPEHCTKLAATKKEG